MFLIVKIDNKFDKSSEIMTVLSQAKGEVCMKTLLSPAISYVLYDRLKEYRGVFLSVCGPVWGLSLIHILPGWPLPCRSMSASSIST